MKGIICWFIGHRIYPLTEHEAVFAWCVWIECSRCGACYSIKSLKEKGWID